jgi:hypothetical protein
MRWAVSFSGRFFGPVSRENQACCQAVMAGKIEMSGCVPVPRGSIMPKRKSPPIRVIRIKPGDTKKTIYAKVRRAFTAADLQKYTEIEEGIPAREVIAELEALDREEAAAHKKRAKRGRSQ